MVNITSIAKAFDPRESKLNILLVAVPLTVYFNYIAHNPNISFITSMIAIMPLAFLMGKATEEIALRTSESVGGLLNATFGNAAEMILALFALYAASTTTDPETAENMIHLVQASLIGSILGNLLLVMGLAFVWGGKFPEKVYLYIIGTSCAHPKNMFHNSRRTSGSRRTVCFIR